MARKKSNTLSLWIMLALIIVITAAVFLLPSCGALINSNKATIAKVGDQAPNFTVEMMDGTQVELEQLRGRVVLINFWATWCPPCCAELKHMQTEVVDRFADRDFTLLAISRGEDRAVVEKFRVQNSYSFPMGLDPKESIFGLYATNFIPRNFVIGKDGRVASYTVGYTQAEFNEMLTTIETELAK